MASLPGPNVANGLSGHYETRPRDDGRLLWTNACQACAIKDRCTLGKERHITRWEHEHVVEAVERRLDENPWMMHTRQITVEQRIELTRIANTGNQKFTKRHCYFGITTSAVAVILHIKRSHSTWLSSSVHRITGRHQVLNTSIFKPPGLGPLDMPGQAEIAQLQFISA